MNKEENFELNKENLWSAVQDLLNAVDTVCGCCGKDFSYVPYKSNPRANRDLDGNPHDLNYCQSVLTVCPHCGYVTNANLMKIPAGTRVRSIVRSEEYRAIITDPNTSLESRMLRCACMLAREGDRLFSHLERYLIMYAWYLRDSGEEEKAKAVLQEAVDAYIECHKEMLRVYKTTFLFASHEDIIIFADALRQCEMYDIANKWIDAFLNGGDLKGSLRSEDKALKRRLLYERSLIEKKDSAPHRRSECRSVKLPTEGE